MQTSVFRIFSYKLHTSIASKCESIKIPSEIVEMHLGGLPMHKPFVHDQVDMQAQLHLVFDHQLCGDWFFLNA